MLPAKFYPIAPDYITAKTYIDNGIKFLQIRIKDFSKNEITQQLKDTVNYAIHHNIALVVNDYWQEAIDFGASWIHLGQEDIEIADIKAIRKHNIKLGISTHDTTELDYALGFGPDYVALGPIYFTKLKAMKWDPQGLEKVLEWKKLCKQTPLVGIGGITLERADNVLQAGADCVSFVTDITHHEQPQQRLKAWIQHFS